MLKLDKNKIPIRYLTGVNKVLDDYPTPLDVLYESCMESIDDTLFTPAKMENRYGLSDDRIEHVQNYLLEHGYIEKKTKNFKIINTPWS